MRPGPICRCLGAESCRPAQAGRCPPFPEAGPRTTVPVSAFRAPGRSPVPTFASCREFGSCRTRSQLRILAPNVRAEQPGALRARVACKRRVRARSAPATGSGRVGPRRVRTVRLSRDRRRQPRRPGDGRGWVTRRHATRPGGVCRPRRDTASEPLALQAPSLPPVWGPHQPGRYAMKDNNDPVTARRMISQESRQTRSEGSPPIVGAGSPRSRT